ncbi:MAG: hypothetical protein QG637_1269, partial [Chloroflexota bacterium]|nr:hypothetical protein [Chloroflexota bacterium]
SLRRTERDAYDRVMGPEGAEGLRGGLRGRTDRLRARVAKRLGRSAVEPQATPDHAKPAPSSDADRGAPTP